MVVIKLGDRIRKATSRGFLNGIKNFGPASAASILATLYAETQTQNQDWVKVTGLATFLGVLGIQKLIARTTKRIKTTKWDIIQGKNGVGRDGLDNPRHGPER